MARPRRIVLLAVFASAMAFVEAAVVVYLREIMGLRGAPGPLTGATVERLREAWPWVLALEREREAATIVMLVCVALGSAQSWRGRVGHFLALFGMWDLGYYLWLRVLLGWPPSLWTRDVLFLLPVPWIAPVLFPVTAAVVLTGLGIALILTDRGVPLSRQSSKGFVR